MDDGQIHRRIEDLVVQEQTLWQREAANEASDEDSRRIAELRVLLDQYWDLLRQRRALHDAGLDEDAARVRDPQVVERYQQ